MGKSLQREPGHWSWSSTLTGRAAPAAFGIYDELFQAAYIAITVAILIYMRN
jgi:hypothetical protein